MREFIIFYVGFTMGLCFMDYLEVVRQTDFQMYRKFVFPIWIAILLAPIAFPFYLIVWGLNKSTGRYL